MAKRITDDLKAKLASMHNATPNFLCDELGIVRAKMKSLKDEEDLIKTVLSAKLANMENDKKFFPAQDAIKGDRYILQVIKTSVARFSQELAKKFLTEEQAAECYVTSEMTQYRVKLVDEPEEGGIETRMKTGT